MAVCKKIPRKIERICVGSLNQKIIIFIRTIAPTTTFDYEHAREEPKEVWAMIETKRGTTVFDDTNIERAISHTFYIRQPIFEVYKKNWILYKGGDYEIIDVENLEELDRFLALRCNYRGLSTKQSNLG